MMISILSESVRKIGCGNIFYWIYYSFAHLSYCVLYKIVLSVKGFYLFNINIVNSNDLFRIQYIIIDVKVTLPDRQTIGEMKIMVCISSSSNNPINKTFFNQSGNRFSKSYWRHGS